MPNGGSDCCGTCWFNSKNKGEPGYHGADEPGDVQCTIRDLIIPSPFYTYCINHPHHNPERVSVPIGPVYVGEGREIWVEAPDTEKVHTELIRLLSAIPETPEPEYPFGLCLADQIVQQVGVLKENKAVEGLKRVIAFDPTLATGKPFFQDYRTTIGFAIESLAMILADEAIPEIERNIRLGIDNEEQEERFAVIRYFAVRALAHCSTDKALLLLNEASSDPDPKIAALAEELKQRKVQQ